MGGIDVLLSWFWSDVGKYPSMSRGIGEEHFGGWDLDLNPVHLILCIDDFRSNDTLLFVNRLNLALHLLSQREGYSEHDGKTSSSPCT